MSTVNIVIPSNRGIQEQTRSTVLQMLRETQCQCGDHAPWACPRGLHDVLLTPTLGSSVIHWCRNQNLALSLYGSYLFNPKRPPAEHFLLVDDDMVVTPHMLKRLISHKKDIVAAICTVRRDPPIPTIRYWNDEKGMFNEPIEWDWSSQKLIEIDAAGAAMMLVTRKVFEKMGQAYLDCAFEREEDKRKYPDAKGIDEYWDKKSEIRQKRFDNAGTEWQKKDCWWFQFPDNCVDIQVGEMGEDLAFCWKAKKLGFRVYADPQVTPGHLGQYAFSVEDYIELTGRWKAEGKKIERNENSPQLGPTLNITEEAVAAAKVA